MRTSFVSLLVALAAFAAAPAVGAAAPPDSTSIAGAPDSTSIAGTPDSTSIASAPDSTSGRARRAVARSVRGDVDVDRLRYEGRTSLLRMFEPDWPVDAVELPIASPTFASPRTLDAGIPLVGWRAPTTDRTPIVGIAYSFGMPNTATAVAAPGPPSTDPFLVTRWEATPARPPMQGGGELLAAPTPVLWWDSGLRSKTDDATTSSALFYEKGELGVEQAGARFVAPSLAAGVAGAYIRRAADGQDSWFRGVDTRYALVVNLPRAHGWSGRLEGDVADRRIESAVPDADFERVSAGEALLTRNALSLRLEKRRGSWEHDLSAGVGRTTHTRVDIDSTRERWREPTWNVVARTRLRLGGGWSGMLEARGLGRGFQSRLGPAHTASHDTVGGEFALTRNEGRAVFALRRESGAAGRTRALSADVAYDARDGDHGFLDARLGFAVTSPRGVAQIDVERAHDRATWEDRLLPDRAQTVEEDGVVLLKPIRYLATAEPSLAPRRRSGVFGRAAWRPSRTVEIFVTGSGARLEHDFGWTLTRTETADTTFVLDRAVVRGDGWVGHVSGGAALTWHSIHARARAWSRLGSHSLSPLAGSPARNGVDASLEAGATFFQGDLPLRLGLVAHATGERTGVVRSDGDATFDASLRADFDQAGLYFKIDDLFDRRPPGGAYDIATDSGVPTAGRRFRFGVVWHLLD